MTTKPTDHSRYHAKLYCAAALGIGVSLAQVAGATFSDANWTPLGSGMSGIVLALATSGNDLYAGGAFTNAGGKSANYIAKWNGSDWSALGSGMNTNVRALAVMGSNLYAGGSFTTAGGSVANYIAKWDGTNWTSLPLGMDCDVYALAVSGNDLYAGGCFTMAGATFANRIAKWNTTFWTALGSGVSSSFVDALAGSGSDLYAGGNFKTAGGSPVNYVAKWDGGNWSALGSGMGGGVIPVVRALATSNGELYASGLFTWATNNGVSVGVSNIAKWNGSTWTNLSSGLTGLLGVSAVVVWGNELLAGGSFQNAGGNPAVGIAKWDGTNWMALGSAVAGGSPPTVSSLAISGNDLYVGGTFTNAGGKACARIARVYLGTLPTLSVARSAGSVTISWPSAGTDGFALERADLLAPPTSWVSNTASIGDDGTSKSVVIPATNSAQFFRLRRP